MLLLCLVVVAGIGGYGISRHDFLTPPSEAQLAENRARVEAALPQSDFPDDAVSVPAVLVRPNLPPPPPEPPKKPAVELGDLTKPPALGEYLDAAPKGTAYFVELAGELEANGQFKRALLAWERVLDTGRPDPVLAGKAVAAINRLRPTLPAWNENRDAAIAITLHAGASKTSAKTLTPVLVETARELERASAGILKINAIVTSSRSQVKAKRPAPVAVSLKGPGKSQSTEMLMITTGSSKSLRDDLFKTVFELIRGHLDDDPSRSPPAPLVEGADPRVALHSHVTRLHWQELGAILNRPAKMD